MESPYLKELTSAPYSVATTEKRVVKIATTIAKHLPGEELVTMANAEPFIDYLCKNTKQPRSRVIEMLRRILPMKRDGVNLLRLAYAIANYFKYFDPLDISACPPYTGNPTIEAHAKIIGAKPVLTGKQVTVNITFMLMTSIFAGDIKTLQLSHIDADKLMSTIGLSRVAGRKDKPLPQELFGTYCTVTLGNKPNQVAVIKDVTATSSEKRVNKRLRKDRITKQCDESPSCATCCRTVKECPIACRY